MLPTAQSRERRHPIAVRVGVCGIDRKEASMRTRRVTILATLFALLFVLGTTEASANTYPGLVEKSYTHGNDTLTARIAIEVNGSSQGRYRFHLTCNSDCNMGFESATWCDLTTGACATGPGSTVHDSDNIWWGTYRTLANNHTYAAKASNFSAFFYASGYQGALHTICTKRVTWHSGGSPTIGSAWC
jgi:hypothetical protein